MVHDATPKQTRTGQVVTATEAEHLEVLKAVPHDHISQVKCRIMQLYAAWAVYQHPVMKRCPVLYI